jgi:hypothetical protein
VVEALLAADVPDAGLRDDDPAQSRGCLDGVRFRAVGVYTGELPTRRCP